MNRRTFTRVMRGEVACAMLASTVVAAGVAGCDRAGGKQGVLTPATVQLPWLHQAQSAGFYVADRRGYYAEEGVAVRFLEGGPGVDRTRSVLDGRAQFGQTVADLLILSRAAGQPVRAIATIFRRSPIVFVTPADSGIRKPQDFVGRRIRVSPELLATLHAMTERVGVSPGRYAEIELPSDVRLFAAGKADVWGVYSNGFLVTLLRAGHRPNVIYPDDYGVHFYADMLFTTDGVISTDPEPVRRFLRATLRGWTYAVEHAAEVGALVVGYKPDAELETAKMVASLPLVNTGEDRVGWMKTETWAGMERTLRAQHVLTAPLDVKTVYTTRFLDDLERAR